MKEISSNTIEYHDPLSLFNHALKNLEYSQILHSSDTENPMGKYSFIVYDPIETIKYNDNKTTLKEKNEKETTLQGNPFSIINNRLETLCGYNKPEHKDNLPPFQGGALGFFGYDLCRLSEEIPTIAKNNPKLDDMIIGIYDKVIAYDHENKKCWIITRSDTHSKAKNSNNSFKQIVNDWLSQINTNIPKIEKDEFHLNWTQETKKEDYLQKIKKTINFIYDGDIFQANISQKFSAKTGKKFDHFIHYCHLNEINPAPFSAFLNFGDIKISSASPERFLFIENKEVITRPIKGTKKRSNDFLRDEEIKEELRRSHKDRAENAMIVDLMRSDLSKTCSDHSIETTELCKVETFATVHHLVSTIKGKLRSDLSSIDLLESCFPGGSITGAPKVRAMEIIDELETSRRGPYCGSIGYIGFDMTMDTNIAIRTITYFKDEATIRVGGGITAKSNPEGEYQETLDKAYILLKSFTSEGIMEKLS